MQLQRSTARLTTASAVLALAVVGTAGAAIAATVRPMTASNCGQAHNYITCAYIVGSGLHITQWEGESNDYTLNGTGETYHVELTGPGWSIGNGNTVTNSNGGTVSLYSGNPNANEPAGNYCGTTWVWGGGTYYYNDGSDCVNVHS